MGRKVEPTLDRTLTSRLREEILGARHRLEQRTTDDDRYRSQLEWPQRKSTGAFIEKLTQAINHRHGDEDYLSERTVWRYLSNGTSLSLKAALDLIAGCNCIVGMRLPRAFVDEIYRKSLAPKTILFTNESAKLAAVLATRAKRVVRLTVSQEKRLRKEYADFLAPYENFNKIELGRTVWFWIRSYFGSRRWELAFNQLRMGVDVSPNGRQYKVPGSLIEAIAVATDAEVPFPPQGILGTLRGSATVRGASS